MPAPDLLTIAQTAQYLGVNPATIRRLIASGRLKAYRYGPRIIRIDQADVHKLRRPVTSLADLGGAA